MISPQTQSQFISQALMAAMDEHPEYNKSDIITVLVDQGFLRPTIRRVKRDLLKKLEEYVGVLK